MASSALFALGTSESIINAVVRFGSNRWRQIGRLLFSCHAHEVDNLVSGLPRDSLDSDRLREIISRWLISRGREATYAKLREACEDPDVSIWGAVRDAQIERSSAL